MMDISVIIPCRNEENHIVNVLNSLSKQTFRGTYEVIVADGDSTDKTWSILQQFKEDKEYPYELILLSNKNKYIPHALNMMVSIAKGKYIIRIDGHSIIEPRYIETIYEYLQVEVYDVAGPRICNVPYDDSLQAKVISSILNSKFGNGGTASRNKILQPRKVEHTVMSCYRKEVWEKIGGYDENLLSNEDFDFDYRAKKEGFNVYSLPEPVFYLKARSNIKSLVKQRWRYGYWKAQVLKKHPSSLKVRQLIPILALMFGMGLLFLPKTLLFMIALYLLLIVYFMDKSISKGKWVKSFTLHAVSVFVIQFVWAAGVVYGLLSKSKQG